jgi:hypothetical protein
MAPNFQINGWLGSAGTRFSSRISRIWYYKFSWNKIFSHIILGENWKTRVQQKILNLVSCKNFLQIIQKLIFQRGLLRLDANFLVIIWSSFDVVWSVQLGSHSRALATVRQGWTLQNYTSVMLVSSEKQECQTLTLFFLAEYCKKK